VILLSKRPRQASGTKNQADAVRKRTANTVSKERVRYSHEVSRSHLYSSRINGNQTPTTRGRKKLVLATLTWSLKIDTAPSFRWNSVNYRNPQWELPPQHCHSRYCVDVSRMHYNVTRYLKDRKGACRCTTSPLVLDGTTKGSTMLLLWQEERKRVVSEFQSAKGNVKKKYTYQYLGQMKE
jgi:hypothetical protein